MTAHRCLTFRLPADLEEPLGAALWSAGTTGLVMRDAGASVEIDAYFPGESGQSLGAHLAAAWRDRGVTLVGEATFGDEDWLATYRAQAQPFDVGRRFRVDPRDLGQGGEASGTTDRTVLRIPAATAFGTGSHETTRLAVSLLESMPLAGHRVLDVGTGSGILALVALHLGARLAIGFDLDLPSVIEAGRNAARNGADPSLYAGRLEAIAAPGRFDTIVVNILPERVRDDLPAIAAALRPNGRVVSSGSLADDGDAVLRAWAAFGLVPVRALQDGEWIAWVLRPEAA